MILIKLGGSVITDKSREYSFRPDTLKRLIEETKTGARGERYIIVHGGGSFGHPGAKIYGLNTSEPVDMARGTAEVQYRMRTLNQMILDIMLKSGLWAVSVPGGLVTSFHGGHLVNINTEMIEELVNIGTVPVAFGDVALDKVHGVTICSGDDLMLGLAHVAEKAIFVTDVDGIYKGGTVCEVFTRDMLPLTLEDIFRSKDRIDVTGGMNEKANKMLEMADHCPSFIVNGMVEGRLKRVLREETTVCTEVRA